MDVSTVRCIYCLQISEDVAMEIGTALIQLATKSFTHTVGKSKSLWVIVCFL